MNYKVIADSLKNRKIIRNNLKVKLLAFAMGANVFIGGKAFAQVPSYVPTNGLVGYWPFNGNANDESGNGNNGTVNGATLTADRFGNSGTAYSFSSSVSNYISSDIGVLSNDISICGWYNAPIPNKYYPRIFFYGDYPFTTTTNQFDYISAGIMGNEPSWINNYTGKFHTETNITNCNLIHPVITANNQWHFFMIICDTQNSLLKLYIDGQFVSSTFLGQNTINSSLLFFGRDPGDSFGGCNSCGRFNGKLDDLAIWNRALTQQEITALYNGCGNEITSQPINANINAGSNAQFSVNAISGSSCQWQSNPLNMGWQNITNNSSYSGATSNTLSVSNTAVSNHNQPFRAIVNAGTCIDTSDIAQIIIGDTCLSTTYDTLLTTVTDTLIINTTLSLPSPNNENTIKIYPNPASDHITIDNGNFAAMAGYSIKITNNAGQQVFQNAINQAQFNVDLSTWSGNGLYFVHLIDSQNNTVTIRKIVLQ